METKELHSVHTGVMLTPTVRAKLESEARERGLKMSALGSKIIEDYFDQPTRPESEALRKLQGEILARPIKLFGQGEVVFIAFLEYLSEDSNETDWFIFEAIVESKHCETYCINYYNNKIIRWEYEEDQVFRTRAEAEAYAQKLKGDQNES